MSIKYLFDVICWVLSYQKYYKEISNLHLYGQFIIEFMWTKQKKNEHKYNWRGMIKGHAHLKGHLVELKTQVCSR